MKKIFKITENDRVFGIILMVLSVISIILGILSKLDVLRLNVNALIKSNRFSLYLIILGFLSFAYSIYVTIVAFKIKDNI